MEIDCPGDCVYLVSAREHPAAVVLRQQQEDVGRLVPFIRSLDERQSRLFFLAAAFLVRYRAPELQPLIDDDVAAAAAAVAATFETSARGVIYEHRPATPPAERLAAAWKEMFAEAAAHATSAFDRDAALVARRIEQAARDIHALDPSNRRGFVDLLGRVIRPADTAAAAPVQPEPSRLIVP